MDKNKKIFIELVVVLVLVGFGLWALNRDSTPAVNPDNSNNTADNSYPTPSEDTGAGSVNSGAGAATLSYQNALVTYKDARLQLNKDCQGSPDKMTFKNGASMMVDNRSALTRTVKLGSTFTIKPWGFKIVKLESSTLPATWLVDCGSSQNVSTITIQK